MVSPRSLLAAALLASCSAAATPPPASNTTQLIPEPLAGVTNPPIARPLTYAHPSDEGVVLVEAPVGAEGPLSLTVRSTIFVVNQGTLPSTSRLSRPTFALTSSGRTLTSQPDDRVWCATANGARVGDVIAPPSSTIPVTCWWTSERLDADSAPGRSTSLVLRSTIDAVEHEFSSTVSAERTRRWVDPSGRFLLSYPASWTFAASDSGDRVDLGNSALVPASPGTCRVHLARGDALVAPLGDQTEIQIDGRRYPAFTSTGAGRRFIQARVDVFHGPWLVQADCADPTALENMRLIHSVVLDLWRAPAP